MFNKFLKLEIISFLSEYNVEERKQEFRYFGNTMLPYSTTRVSLCEVFDEKCFDWIENYLGKALECKYVYK